MRLVALNIRVVIDHHQDATATTPAAAGVGNAALAAIDDFVTMPVRAVVKRDKGLGRGHHADIVAGAAKDAFNLGLIHADDQA